MRHERHPGNAASEMAFGQAGTPTGPFRGPTVKDFLTVELVSDPYKFKLPSHAAVGATGKDSLPVHAASEPVHPTTVKEWLDSSVGDFEAPAPPA